MNGTLLALLIEHEWKRTSTGETGSLWSREGDVVGIPDGLTPEHWEWDGVVKRIVAP